ncbi:MAG: glycosyltransferase [Thermodesulfobacteriota bacterium]|nr:glycosyltransferase [Thermodesulfobacteriota bacterium]
MNISVIIPCLNEEANIEPCLNALLKQTYPGGRYEIIVVDGGSMDRTQAVVRDIEKAHENVRLILEFKKGTAAGRNTGVKASRYDHVAFIDADCEAPRDWLTTLVHHYGEARKKDRKVAAVGGGNIPPENSDEIIRAIAIALDSYPGSFGSVQGRRFKKMFPVASLANLNALYDKKAVIDVGRYDESLGSEAEDADLNFRLHSAGYRLIYVPDSFVWHKMRATLRAWYANMFRYGKGRARLLKRYPQMWSVSYCLPIIFLIGISSVVFAPILELFLLPLFYFPFIFVCSLFQCLRNKRPALTFHVMFVYVIQHFGYAIGEVYGLLNPNVR